MKEDKCQCEGDDDLEGDEDMEGGSGEALRLRLKKIKKYTLQMELLGNFLTFRNRP
jgi:hypothetical protein